MKRPYIDDAQRMALVIKNNSWDVLKEELLPSSENSYTYDFVEDGKLYAFSVSQNRPLSKLTGRTVSVVRFAFTEIDDESSEAQRKSLIRLFEALSDYMEKNKAYYNVRIPANYPDILYALNSVGQKGFLCGGNQTYMSGRAIEGPATNFDVFVADKEYLSTHSDALLRITDDSFSSFRGQYHISPVTYPYADSVYRNWIESAISAPSDNQFFLVAEQDEKLLGYILVEDNGNVADISLTAVSPLSRGKGVYKTMVAKLLTMCRAKDCVLVAGTQFDNYGSQVTWTDLGMKPYFAFYNMHYDM